MLAYTIRRLAYAILAFLLLTYAIWLLTTRGGIYTLHHFRWDALLPAPYQLWMVRVLHGDLGYSLRAHAPVLSAMRDALGVSLLLIIPAFILQEIIAVALGLLAGSRYRSWMDRLISVFSFIGISTPNFWLALLLVEFFAVQLQVLPVSGLVNYRLLGTTFATPEYWAYFHANTVAALLDLAKHLILPITVLAFTGIAADSQFVRLALVEVLSQDYIRAAHARGLSKRAVLWKHALRNTLVPLLTNVGLQLPRLIFSAMIIELVFALPGVGHLFATAIYTPLTNTNIRGVPGVTRFPKDYDVIAAYFLVLSVVSLLATIGTDLLYASADPRIRLGNEAAPLASNPFTSRHPLLRCGEVQVQVRAIVIALTTIAIVVAGVTVIRQLLTPTPPSIAGTWSGTVALKSNTPPSFPVIMTVQVTRDGTITGLGYDCERADPAYPPVRNRYIITGETDLRRFVTLSWLPPNNSVFAYLGLDGQYPTDNHAVTINGEATNQYLNASFPATMHLQRGGDLAQFQASCR